MQAAGGGSVEPAFIQSDTRLRKRPGGAGVVERRVRSGEARVVAAPMPVGVERRHQVAGRAAGGIGEATLPRLPECGEARGESRGRGGPAAGRGGGGGGAVVRRAPAAPREV